MAVNFVKSTWFTCKLGGMHISAHDHIAPLGWLPLTTADRVDGILPVYRRLRKAGRAIVDEGDSLTPGLYWRHGRGQGEHALECYYALSLIRASAVSASRDTAHIATECSPEFFARLAPDMEAVADDWIRRRDSAIALTSPTLLATRTRSDWLATLPRLLPVPVIPRLGSLMRDPARLMRVGFSMLMREWKDHGQCRPRTAEALAVIGLGALGLFPRLRCHDCFRVAMPASTRCAYHSQSQAIRLNESGAHAQIAAESRLGARAIAKLGWSESDLASDRGEDPDAEEKTVAGVLWGLDTEGSGYPLSHLKEQMRSGALPRVRALLPPDFCELNDVRASAALRRKLDPNEWVPSYWFTRAAAAEAWLEAAESLSPGRTQMQQSVVNRKRVAEARLLIYQGNPHKVVAARLGITPSHLSHLLRRIR